MHDDDSASVDSHAAAVGILQGLLMLAEEADNLRMARTHLALRKAIRACQAEQARRDAMIRPRARRFVTLH